MNPKTLFTVGFGWLVAVALWVVFGRGAFAITLLGRGKLAEMAARVLLYMLGFLTVGWMLPLALGVFLLLRKHFWER